MWAACPVPPREFIARRCVIVLLAAAPACDGVSQLRCERRGRTVPIQRARGAPLCTTVPFGHLAGADGCGLVRNISVLPGGCGIVVLIGHLTTADGPDLVRNTSVLSRDVTVWSSSGTSLLPLGVTWSVTPCLIVGLLLCGPHRAPHRCRWV